METPIEILKEKLTELKMVKERYWGSVCSWQSQYSEIVSRCEEYDRVIQLLEGQ